MSIVTEKYIRKPLYVDAVRVTEENFDNVSTWCEGSVDIEPSGPREGKRFIKVNVHGIPKNQRQTKAFVGDWLLHTERGFKVYTDNAFRASFNPVTGVDADAAVQAEKHQVLPVAEPVIEEIVPGAFVPATSIPQDAQPNPAPVVEATLERAPLTAVPEPAIADVDGQPIGETPMVSDSDSAPPPVAENGRRVITFDEQRVMDQSEIAELLRSGRAVLEQDLV